MTLRTRGSKVRSKAAVLAGAATFALLGVVGAWAHAEGNPAANVTVLTVGKTQVTVGEIERRLRKIPPFQLHMYGKDDDAIRHKFLNKVLIPEVLFAEGAKARGRDKLLDVQERKRELLKTALLMDIRDQVLKNAKFSQEEIQAYYKAHYSRYHSPARYSIWRILLPTKDKAQEVLTRAQQDPTPKTWKKLAAENSVDKPTALRGGNLGFLKPDGSSLDGKQHVPEEVMKAALKVRDGEIVPEVIPEGSGFAVVWRRGSLPEIKRTLQQERNNIVRILARKKIQQQRKQLVARLEREFVSAKNPDATALIEVSGGGKIVPASKPGRIERKLPPKQNPEPSR